MQSEGDATVRTAPDVSADTALDEVGEPSAVEKNQGLMPASEIVVQCLYQLVREKLPARSPGLPFYRPARARAGRGLDVDDEFFHNGWTAVHFMTMTAAHPFRQSY